MRIVCQQTILVKYHSLLVIFEKAAKFDIVLLQIIGGTLRVNDLCKQSGPILYIKSVLIWIQTAWRYILIQIWSFCAGRKTSRSGMFAYVCTEKLAIMDYLRTAQKIHCYRIGVCA